MVKKYDAKNLLSKGQKFIELKKKESKSHPEVTIVERVKFKKQESDDKNLLPMPELEGDAEGVKKGKRLTILTPNKLLTRFSILLA